MLLRSKPDDHEQPTYKWAQLFRLAEHEPDIEHLLTQMLNVTQPAMSSDLKLCLAHLHAQARHELGGGIGSFWLVYDPLRKITRTSATQQSDDMAYQAEDCFYFHRASVLFSAHEIVGVTSIHLHEGYDVRLQEPGHYEFMKESCEARLARMQLNRDLVKATFFMEELLRTNLLETAIRTTHTEAHRRNEPEDLYLFMHRYLTKIGCY